ncbi:MAG TPA: MBL fold metallo-hydrolase [Longimicrobium sp.]|jgi:hypothetical protein|uniref:MBL fold metallo-hydrolase n=1 Tax=Longimicrobium sp. TaxID=2029185 RepID=UPI002ED7B877
MYRQGLGDCFLLSFPAEGGGTFSVLIDCGVLLGTEDAPQKMQRVARSIALETGGSADGKTKGRIDVLVGTHQHWDHLSGFVQARKEFDELVEVGEVWLAWTENPGHPLASELRRDRSRKIAHLRSAAIRMRGIHGMGDTATTIDTLLGFFGAQGGDGTTEDALSALSTRSDARVIYRRPGEPVFALPGTNDVRVYVLGPPEDRVMIKKSDPTRRGREVYDLQPALSLTDTFFAAVALGTESQAAGVQLDPEAAELAFPFDRKYRLDPKAAHSYAVPSADGVPFFFFQDRYGFDPVPQANPSTGEEQPTPEIPIQADRVRRPGWRRIDGDWLGAAADLALALDSDTNNTSLALAFELGEGGPVLLFPADAQVGNWLSWSSLAWPVRPSEPDGGGKVTIDDLLERTVLYKVGHHASHNATMRAQGLEKMNSPNLVALIPVDEGMAKKRKWKMPFCSLYERLKERTRGRILRADHGRLPFNEAAKYGLSQEQHNQWERRTPGDDLWIDCYLDS